MTDASGDSLADRTRDVRENAQDMIRHRAPGVWSGLAAKAEGLKVTETKHPRMITVKMAGATWDWLEQNTSWGMLDHDDQVEKDARAAVMAAKGTKVGKGWTHTVDLPDVYAESVWSILNSIAGAGESMTSEERGGDTYAYKVMRRDADRIKESLVAAGWIFIRQGIFENAEAPKEETEVTDEKRNSDKFGELMTQTEARAEAKRLQEEGIPAIAGAVPPNSWGGEEKGWTVYLPGGEKK